MGTGENLESSDRSVPLCLHCLEPYDPLRHYCPKCSRAVGQFTPNIPFVSIGYECEFWGGLWKKVWSKQESPVFVRVVGILLILFFVPILLLAMPFALIGLLRTTRRGFDVLGDAEQRAGTRGSGPMLPRSEAPPEEDRPPTGP